MQISPKISHADSALNALNAEERQQLQCFLRLSTRKATSAKAMERQLMLSLSFANRNVSRGN